MQTYSEFKPSHYDQHIALDGKEDWLVLPCGRNRDSNCLEESNFAAAIKMLKGKSATVEVHCFGHWACGWFEIIIVAPDSDEARIAAEIVEELDDYPILDESDFSEREMEEANETWKACYNNEERIAYIRNNRSQFEFSSFADMLSCVRGKYFAGYASELLQS